MDTGKNNCELQAKKTPIQEPLICQCCGMPLDETLLSREPDGAVNREYCRWCYADGRFRYDSKEQLIDFCAAHLATEDRPAEQIRAHMEAVVPTLKHWNRSK